MNWRAHQSRDNCNRPVNQKHALDARTRRDQQFIQKAIEIVLENLTDTDFDVTTFASEMALSRAQMHRKMKAFKEQFGVTPSEYDKSSG